MFKTLRFFDELDILINIVEKYKKREREVKMYNISICDDVNRVCSYIENVILEYTLKKNIKVNTEVWYTGESLCDYLKTGQELDILFLDIELFRLNGIQVAEYIRNILENRSMQIIYISGKDSYAQKLFKTQPMDFLVKPIKKEDLIASLKLAFKILDKENDKFRFQCGKEYHSIPYGEIIYFTSDKRKIIIVTQKTEYCFYGKMKELIEKLPSDFIMIHQSYIVNQKYIVQYTYENVELERQTVLPISTKYRKQVRKYLLENIK